MVVGDYIRQFHNLYQGPPISLWLTGGGFGFLEILKRPGCSRFLHDIVIPYSEEAITARMLEINRPTLMSLHSCSKEASFYYLEYLKHHNYMVEHPLLHVSVTAALTTNRYRKGENRVFISIQQCGEKIRTWKLTLFHPSEKFFDNPFNATWLREIEDSKLSLVLMSLLTNQSTEFDPALNRHHLKKITGAENNESLIEVTDEY